LIQKAANYKSFGVTKFAIEALKKALEIDSTNVEAKGMLKEIEK